VLGPGDLCCNDPAASIDRDGNCCSGTLDACGVCNGLAVAIDVLQQCCNTPLTASGQCCDGGVVDDCGVCGGDNRCDFNGRLLVTFSSDVGLSDLVLEDGTAAKLR
jgi:hypothetical protein